MKLGDLQALFWAVAAREPRGPGDLSDTFVGSTALGAAARMDIYANMFVWRQADALREDFPKLAGVVGAEAFYSLCEEYIRSHPSVHPSLSKLGRQLVTFLRDYPASRADLADMAALEWARAEVFEEAVVPVATAPDIRAMAAGDLVNQALVVVPALRLLHLKHDVCRVWQEVEDGMPISTSAPSLTWVVVWRRDFDVFHVRVENDEATALRRAMAGMTMSVICEAFAERSDATEAARRALVSWVGEGWLAKPIVPR